MAISIYKSSEETIKNIICDYQNNYSMRQLENKYNVSRQSISKYLKERNIREQKGNHYRKYFHNIDFFENIDTEEKAYWLGFMFADGYIVNNDKRYGQDAFGLSVAKQDYEILEKYKKSINATNPIKIYPRKNNEGQDLCRLQMVSQKTVNDLISHGCVKQKTKILQPPTNIPEELIHHFIRGFFDGDGCITIVNSKYLVCDISIVSTYEMIHWIIEKIQMGGILKDKRHDSVWVYELGGNKQILKFYNYLYSDATIFLNRKYFKFQDFLAKYNESQGKNV